MEANNKGGARSEVFQKVPGGLCPLMSAEAAEPGELGMVLIINPCWRQLPEPEFQRETKRPNKHVTTALLTHSWGQALSRVMVVSG